jgi:hypothetical protein
MRPLPPPSPVERELPPYHHRGNSYNFSIMGKNIYIIKMELQYNVTPSFHFLVYYLHHLPTPSLGEGWGGS